MPIWPKQSQMNSFYGNPDKNEDGQPDASWVAANIIKIVPPYQLYYPLEKTLNGKKVLVKREQKFKSLHVHKKCADSLMVCLTEIKNQIDPLDIEKYELDICGGTFVFRLMRNGRALSIHSWGSAIDLSHLINYYERKYNASKNMMPQKVVGIFKQQGWVWGGLWSTPDAMHFQAANLG